MIIKMPRWQSYMATTTQPIFTPQQCEMVIQAGHKQKPEVAQVGMNKPGGGVDTKKELRQYLGFLLKKCLRCIHK